MQQNPLVSIIIPNFNHSKYLDQCIQSALNQTFNSIEIVLLDNQSDDNSIEIAAKYIKQGVRISRNPFNFINFSYRILAEDISNQNSKYLMMLPADDFIEPTFIQKSIKVMEENNNVGYVHVDRDFITDNGERIEQDPFYSCSFIAPGIDVMPIYMMTTVAHPAQGIFRRDIFNKIEGYNAVVDHMNADKNLWFYLSTVSDYAYIREKLAFVRIGSNTETFLTQSNFQHPLLTYMTVMDFTKFAENQNLKKVSERKQMALDKLAEEFLLQCTDAIACANFNLARKYLVFCKMLSRKIENNDLYLQLYQMWETKKVDIDYLIIIKKNNFQRKRGYRPPVNYKEIFIV